MTSNDFELQTSLAQVSRIFNVINVTTQKSFPIIEGTEKQAILNKMQISRELHSHSAMLTMVAFINHLLHDIHGV